MMPLAPPSMRTDPLLARFYAQLSARERQAIDGLTSPSLIQGFLDALPYSTEPQNRTPLRVLRDHMANCLDGALLAAALLRRLGQRALIIDLLPAPGTDDVHILALFHDGRHVGALAKSNCVGLRYREPVYRSLRELVMSYFEQYYNLDGRRCLRAYTRPLDLASLDAQDWMLDEASLDPICDRLAQRKAIALLSPRQAKRLVSVDARSYEAGLLGANPAGLFRPGSSKS